MLWNVESDTVIESVREPAEEIQDFLPKRKTKPSVKVVALTDE